MNKKTDSNRPSRIAGHVKLETRRLLNAEFDLFGGTALILDEFVNSDAGADQVTITQSGTVYSFVLGDGVWSGDDSPLNISGDGTDTLTVDTGIGALSSILLNSTTADQFDVNFGDFDFAQPLSITNSGGSALFGTVDQQALTTFVSSGTLTISGAETIDLQNGTNNFSIVDITNATDVSLTDIDGIQLTSLEATNDATILAGSTIDVSNAVVGNDLTMTATLGNIIDNGTIDVDGNAQFSATGVGGSITLDQLDVAGTIGLDSNTSATIVNTTAVDLATSTIGTDLDVTATTGDVTDSGTVTVGGNAQFTSTAGAIDLDGLDVTGSIGVASSTSSTIVNVGAIDLSLSTVGTDLNVTSTTAGILDSGSVTVGGDACFDSADSIVLDDLNVTGSIGLTVVNNATLVNATTIDFKASTVGGNLDATATTGDVTDSAAVIVGGDACFEATAGSINLDLLDVTGSIGLVAATSATIVNTTAVDLKATTVGTDLDVTATTGDVTDSAAVIVGGDACFEATAGAINLDQLDVTGSIGLVAATSATIVNTTAVDLKATTVGTDLDVTATTGDVTDSAAVIVGGDACFEATAGAINLDQLDVTGSIGLVAATSATIVNTTAVDLKATTVGTDLDVTATTGDVTDSAAVIVGGDACFEATAGAINLDQLDVTGSIGLVAATSATIVNTTAVDLKATTVGTDLDVTATTGDVTDSAAVIVGGDACFEATAGAINLDQLDVTGSIGLVAATSATIVNTTAVDLKATTVGTDLDVTATTGDVTDSAAVIVGGDACFEATAGSINLDQLDVTGSIGLVAATSATIVNTTAVDLKATTVGTDLDVTATTGDVTDSAAVIVGGDACFEATAGAITLDQVVATGSVGLVSANDSTFTAATVDLKSSTVGGNLIVTATAGNITQSAAISVTGTSNINASGDICLTDINNDFGGAVSGTGIVVEFVDQNDLTAGIITATDNIFLRAGATGAGGLTLTGNLTTTALAGQTLLQANTGVIQSAGIITTSQLILGGNLPAEGAGDFDLIQSNVVGAIAADIDGSLDFINSAPIVVDNLTYSSTCGTTEAIIGLDVTTKIRLRALGGNPITLNEAINSQTIFLESDGGITQAATATITGENLMLSGIGLFDLDDATNDVDNLAALLTGTLNFFDDDEITVARLDCDGVIICGLNITTDWNLTTNDGDLFQDPDAAVIIGGNTIINTGTGDVCLTGGDCTGDGLNDNVFTGTLTIVSTGDVVIAEDDDINIDSVTSTGSLRFIGNNIQINTAITADQLLLEASNGVSYNNNLIDVTDLLLSGQGTFDFGGVGDTVNVIDNLATDIDGNLELISSVNLNIGDLTLISDCGNVNICGLNVDAGGGLAGDVNLQLVNADLTQSATFAVEGNTTLSTGTGDICLTGGSCTIGVANENDLNTLVIELADDVSVVDSNSMTVTSAFATRRLHLFAGDISPGDLTIAGNLTAGEQVLLQSSGDTLQTAGIISTTDLLLGSNANTDADGGNFTLTNANTVSNLAAFVAGNLSFNNVNSLDIADLTFANDCGINETICGVETGGDLTLSIGDAGIPIIADLTQTASVRVGGATDLTATGTICLTGADCVTLPGVGNDNDFVGTVTASATTVEIVDINGLTVGDISATNDIRLEAGDGDGDSSLNGVIDGAEILQSGLLQIDGDLTTTAADGQVLLQSDGGITQLATSTITALDLLVFSDHEATSLGGDMMLSGTNAVSRLAGEIGLDGQTFADAQTIDNFGDTAFSFNNLIDLEIADLTYDSACGTNVAACGLTVDGNLTLDVGDGALAILTQSAAVRVTGDADLNSNSIICFTGADCATLPAIGNDNDFVGTVSGSAVAAFEVFDINDLTVGDITAADRIRLVAGNFDGDLNNNNVIDGGEILQSGTLNLTGNLTTTNANSQILLQADNGATQDAASVITTNDLVLLAIHESTSLIGDFVLTGNNDIDRLAADLGFDGQTLVDATGADNFGDVSLNFVNVDSVEIAEIDYVSICSSDSVCGVNVDGDLTLDVTGDISQTASVRVTGDSDLTASGVICLTGADCASLPGIGNDNDFVGTVTASGTTVEIVDINALVVGQVDADADVRLVAGDGDGDAGGNGIIDGTEILQSGVLQLDGNITTNSGQVSLESDGGIVQAAGVGIIADELLIQTNLEATSIGGDVNLIGVNDVVRVAAEIGLDGQTFEQAQTIDNFGDTNLTLNNISSLELADLNYSSACGTVVAICGFDVDGTLTLTVEGDLTQTAPIRVTQTSSITATGTICLTGASCDPAVANQNDFVGEVTATGTTVELVDINELIVGDITAIDDIRLTSGDGNGDLNSNNVIDGTEVLQSGALLINGDLTTTAADGQVLLQTDGGIEQLATSTIESNELLVETLHESTSLVGDVNLIGTNQVSQLAADIAMDGQSLADATNAITDNFGNANFTLNNTLALNVADLNYLSACGTNVAICGVSIDGDLSLTNDGDVTQTASIRVTGDSLLTSTATICFTGADCPTLPGIGNDNDFVGTVTASGTTVELVDINDLTVGTIDAIDDVYLRAGDGETGTLLLTGNVTTTAMVMAARTGQVLLQADTAIVQGVGSVITAGDLFVGSETEADVLTALTTLDGDNVVDRLSVRLNNNFSLTNTVNLEIAERTYSSSCGTMETICGVDLQSDVSLTLVDASLTQSAAITVTGTTTLAVIDGGDLNLTADGDICLTGGECSDLATIGNDNDFGGAIIATGRTVELVDINDLNITSIDAIDDIRLESGSFAGATQTGAINLNGNLTTVNGQVLLQSDGGIEQIATSVITAQDLIVQSTTDADSVVADFNLIGNNQVARLAGAVDVSLVIENRQALEIAEIDYSSSCGTMVSVTGLDVDTNFTAYVNGNLTQTAVVLIDGTTTLAATGNVVLFDGANNFVGEINVNRAADLLAGDLAAGGDFVEIQDVDAMTVNDATANRGIHLRSGDALSLTGNLTADEVLLQSQNGIDQDAAAQINTRQLMLGGDSADEGTGKFVLDSNLNNIGTLAAELVDGTLQLRNNGSLTILALADHTASDLTTTESISGISVTNATVGNRELEGTFENPNTTLIDTIQGDNGNDGDRFNPNADFTNFLNVNDVGLAIRNAGNMASQVGAQVLATDTDIMLKTGANGVLTIGDLVQVSNADNRIVVIAGGDLVIGANGELRRGGTGLVTTEFVDLILKNPGIDSMTNAQVDAALLNQNLEFLAGTPFEQIFHTSVFWGIEGAEDDTFDLASLDSAQLTLLTDLLFDPMSTNFESRSFYGAPFNGIADGIDDEVTSQPIGNAFDNGLKVNDSGRPTASFTRDFLRTNPEFRNVQVMFNDVGINIFENADSNLTDLNVATADFAGLARIGASPVIVTERVEFQLPERVEITRAENVAFFETAIIEEQVPLVQQVNENFVVVVYFESQYEADLFEARFEKLAGENETGEIDFEQVRELLEKNGLESLEWTSDNAESAADVNRIREILERAGLDLGEEDDDTWTKRYGEWLRQSQEGSNAPEVPRGVFKIIEVDGGKAVIQGDDVDRRFVPEPSNESDLKDYPFDPEAADKPPVPEPNEPGDQSYRVDEGNSDRVAQWSSMLGQPTSDASAVHDVAPAATTASTLSVLATLVRRQSKASGSTPAIDSLQQEKAQSPSRNIFSRAARFLRRAASKMNNGNVNN
ncbi:MAG: hypothetical protein AAFN77_13135 [Planctomycetota bacterium]